MKTFDRMKGQFDQLDEYRAHADDINYLCDQLREPASFTKTILARIRDKIVFHFDMDVFAKAISDIDLPTDELVIAEADSANGLNTNYPAPTMLCLNYLILLTPYQFPKKRMSDEEKLRFILDSMDSLSDKVCKVIESILPALLEGHVHVRAV
jgi:hypothetical protein